jgi:hypothetical protein
VVGRFAKEAGLSLETTFHVWKLSHDMLDFILGKVANCDDRAHSNGSCMFTACGCTNLKNPLSHRNSSLVFFKFASSTL